MKRFWTKVDKSDSGSCWEWTAAKNPNGYGMFNYKRKMQLAHRVVWQITNGPIPQGGCILHSCDNPGCVNPQHLRVGTQDENMKDMSRKNRSVIVNKKLDEHSVEQIKKLIGKKSLREIANQFNVSHNTIWQIKKGKAWASVI